MQGIDYNGILTLKFSTCNFSTILFNSNFFQSSFARILRPAFGGLFLVGCISAISQ